MNAQLVEITSANVVLSSFITNFTISELLLSCTVVSFDEQFYVYIC